MIAIVDIRSEEEEEKFKDKMQLQKIPRSEFAYFI